MSYQEKSSFLSNSFKSKKRVKSYKRYEFTTEYSFESISPPKIKNERFVME